MANLISDRVYIMTKSEAKTLHTIKETIQQEDIIINSYALNVGAIVKTIWQLF